jgi:hypothetical protein
MGERGGSERDRELMDIKEEKEVFGIVCGGNFMAKHAVVLLVLSKFSTYSPLINISILPSYWRFIILLSIYL